MKRFLTLSFLAVGAATLASASTITVVCPTSGGSGASGTSTSVCDSAAGPSVGSTLQSIVLTYQFDADFGFGPGQVLETFDVNPQRPTNDAFNGLLDYVAVSSLPQTVTKTMRGIEGMITLSNPTDAQVSAALAGVTIGDHWLAGSGSFNNAAFDFQIDVNYTTASTTPEPATLGLMGGALLGLGFLARKKRT